MAKDRTFPDSNNFAGDAVFGMASPKDRLAAYVLDCTLLLPLVQLLQSPIKKWILESFLYNEGAGVSTFRIFNLLIFISLFIVYYTLMIGWRGQTIGKMFFNLKVISYHGRLTYFQSFLRSLFIFFEMLSFGIPLMAIFSHPMRRPIHDRVADTLVISQKSPVGFPSRKERWRAQWVSGGLSLFLGLSVLNYALLDVKYSTADLDEEDTCQRVVDGVAGDLEKVFESHLLGQISDDCLREQARESLWKSEDEALAQFAMATSLRDDLEKSKEYLDELCKDNPNHHLCELSRWVLLPNEDQPSELAKLLRKLEDKKPYNFVRVYLAAQLNNDRKYQMAEDLLKPIDQPGLLEPVIGALTFHSLVGQLQWDEAYWVAKTHSDVGDQNILYFMQLELKKSQLSTQQQLQLLDYFYPSLSEKNSRRPASTQSIPVEIRDIYNILEGRL